MGEKHIPEQNNAPQRKDHVKDHVSDPQLSDETGHDWTDEGGATPDGPATSTEEN